MRPTALLCLLIAATTHAHSGDHEACIIHERRSGEHVRDKSCDEDKSKNEESESKGPFSKGRVVFRGSANFDLNQSINLGGENADGAAIVGGINLGAGYFIIENLSLDVDASTHLRIAPSFGILDLGLTPGARYQFIPQAYVRVGAPILFLPEFGLGVLGGAGYHQPLGSNAAFVVGVDYTYYLTEYYRRTAPGGRIDVHAGVQTWF